MLSVVGMLFTILRRHPIFSGLAGLLTVSTFISKDIMINLLAVLFVISLLVMIGRMSTGRSF